MSFFAQATLKDFVTDSPPPTKYQPRFGTASQVQCAPFGSTSRRVKPVKQIMPGPGDYNLQRRQQSNLLTINNKQMKFASQQKIQSIFKSRTQRIHPIEHNPQLPGPGEQYSINQHSDLNRSSQSHKKVQRNIFVNDNIKKIPSIPTHLLGYKQGRDGQLIKIKPEETVNLGPGSYEPRLPTNNPIVRWDNGEQRIVEFELNKNKAVGPGSYHLDTNNNSRNNLAATSLASKTHRFDDLKHSSQTPGPADYQYKSVSNQKSDKHFGSTTDRFKIKSSQMPGPGQYVNSLEHNFLKRSISAFNTTSKKIEAFSTDSNINPGPGTYDLLKKSARTKNVIIGFEERFQKKADNAPGPAEYTGQLKRQSKSMVSIKPATKRLIEKQQESIPTSTMYTVDHFTIQRRLRGSTNSTNKLTKGAFNTTSNRFSYQKANNVHNTPTVIRAAIGKLKDKLIIRSNKFDKPQIPFNARTERKFIIKEDVPSPALYENVDKSWLKKSFNVKMTQL